MSKIERIKETALNSKKKYFISPQRLRTQKINKFFKDNPRSYIIKDNIIWVVQDWCGRNNNRFGLIPLTRMRGF